MSDLQVIAERLANPPFDIHLSMVDLGQRQGLDMLQLVMDACSRVQPKLTRADVRREGPRVVADRVELFLRMTKYRPPGASMLQPGMLVDALASAQNDTLVPVLRWLVGQGDALTQAAHVGWFLTNPTLPDSIRMDAEAQQLLADIKSHQEDFIALHKSLAEQEAARADESRLQEDMKQLQEDKHRLETRVERLRERVQEIEEGETIAAAAQAVREAREAGQVLRRQIRSQVDAQGAMQRQLEEMQSRTRQLRFVMEGGSAEEILRAQTEVVADLRVLVQETLPKQLEQKEARLLAMRQALAYPAASEEDLGGVTRERDEAARRLAELVAEKQGVQAALTQDRGYLALRQQQQMFAACERKLTDMRAKKDRVEEKRRALLRELEEKTGAPGANGGGVADSPRPGSFGAAGGEVTPEALAAREAALNARLPEYRRAKAELGGVEAESWVLDRTAALLEAQAAAMREQVHEIEAQSGVKGYSEASAQLARVGQGAGGSGGWGGGVGGMTDEAERTAVVGEMGHAVNEVGARIKAREAELVPLIKERRALKEEETRLQSIFDEKSREARRVLAEASSGYRALEDDVGQLRGRIEGAQRQHFLAQSCLAGVVEARVKLANISEENKRMQMRLKRTLSEAEKQAEALRLDERDSAKVATSLAGQNKVLAGLKDLLDAKLRSRGADGTGGFGDQQEFTTAAGNVFVL
ncbi:unnamed protein product [Pedinophyceae sp. YPF-701]|nr:unnamed protein product [Pedinophyceae sp. YPF-701]